MFYKILYERLCLKGKSFKNQYKKHSGLHRHHIVPRHMCGTDDESNLTYLSVREHIIAHFLLWKIYRNPNDLRAIKMLGGNLSTQNRKIIGEYCRDNKLGFHNPKYNNIRHEWSAKAYVKPFKEKRGIFDPDKKSYYCSLGGKASWRSGNNEEFKFWASSEGRRQRAIMGNKAQPKKPATNGVETRKFHTEEDRQNFLDNNPGWRIGTHVSRKGIKTNTPSPNRKRVIIDGILFESLAAAATHFQVSSATIINRCRSLNWPSWNYLSDETEL